MRVASKTLLLALPGVTNSVGARVEIQKKTVSGLRAYAERWDGPFVVVARKGVATDQYHLGEDWHDKDDLPFTLVLAEDPVEAVRSLRADVEFLPMHPDYRSVVRSGHTVFGADNSPRVPVDYALVEARGLRTRSRIRLGGLRKQTVLASMARRASGVMCNGPLSYDFYSPINPRSLLFYDSRVNAADIPTGEPAGLGDLRFGFSGRWVAQKGVLHAVRAAEIAGVRLDVIGGGPLAGELKARGSSRINIIGSLDFETEWKPYVASAVDVMMLPHVQPDSSSTYLEALACGAPVLAYDNNYWRPMRELVGGWAVPVGNIAGLADALRRLTRDDVATARRQGVAFAREHTFERTFDRRVAFLEDALS